jgi:hypothetical protein
MTLVIDSWPRQQRVRAGQLAEVGAPLLAEGAQVLDAM